jgi:hypothetical protein
MCRVAEVDVYDAAPACDADGGDGHSRRAGLPLLREPVDARE